MTSLTFLRKAVMAATGATVVTFAGGQAAEAVTFNFGGFDLESSLSFSQDGIDVTATGFDEDDNARLVSQGPGGLGVFGGLGDSFQVDGAGPDETLRLAFDQIVTLTSASFSRVGDFTNRRGRRINDEVRLIVDGVLFNSADIPGGNLFDTDQGTFAGLSITGQVFDFTVTDRNDDYFLRSIEVEPVPEPLTILGSLSALGMGALLKKQNAKSQKKG